MKTVSTAHTGLRSAWVALALILAWLCATAWMRPLLLPDEGRYASVAWEMVRTGDWLTPMLDGLPFFHKPPLFYWISASALAVLGPVEIAGRAGSLFGASLGAFALFLFTRRWSGPAAAQRTLWVLLVQPLFFVGGQYANLDMLVAGCITATVLALAHTALSFELGQPYRRTLWLAYGLAGLGVLAKGLIGFVLPGLVICVWLALRWRWRTLWALVSVPGLLLFLLVAAPWFLAMQQRFDGFLHYFFVVQHFQRFSVGGFNNVMPVWFYPVVLALFSLPCLVWAYRVLGRGYFAPGPAEAPQRGAVRLLMAVAVFCVVAFFSIPKSKLVGYVLPAVVPLAWIMADASLLLTSLRARRAWWVCAGLSALAGLAVVLGLALDQRHSTRDLGRALGAVHQPGQPVFMLEEYLYDVPFYARLQDPVIVVDEWDSPDVAKRDNWRKEIADAGVFSPEVARQLLLTRERLAPALCQAPVSWVLGSQGLRDTYPFLEQAQKVYTHRGDETLWRVEPQRMPLLNCAEMPSGGSAHR
jgi:4-amino-4-deoxy-L-arabinose transferase-like glycosyltransferase